MDILEHTANILIRRVMSFEHGNETYSYVKDLDYSNKNSINITFVTLLILFGVGIGACFSKAVGAFSLERTVYPDLNIA